MSYKWIEWNWMNSMKWIQIPKKIKKTPLYHVTLIVFRINSDSWNIISLIRLPLKWDFLNFPPFPSFRISCIAQNENPKMSDIFNSLKILTFLKTKLSKYTQQMVWKVWSPAKPKSILFFQLIHHITFVVSCEGNCSLYTIFWGFFN